MGKDWQDMTVEERTKAIQEYFTKGVKMEKLFTCTEEEQDALVGELIEDVWGIIKDSITFIDFDSDVFKEWSWDSLNDGLGELFLGIVEGVRELREEQTPEGKAMRTLAANHPDEYRGLIEEGIKRS